MEIPKLPTKVSAKLSTEEIQALKIRWLGLAADFNIPDEEAESIYDQIQYEYSNWDRAYHNLSHLQSLFALKDQYLGELEQPKMVEFAIWFHDYIYDTKRKDNERQSAHWMQELLQDYLKPAQLEYIRQLILSTEGHKARMQKTDCLYFLDFDLSVLGADRDIYIKYKDAIAEEYRSIFSFIFYKQGRKKVLQNFLSRKRLFLTDTFHNFYEKRARANINWEIKPK